MKGLFCNSIYYLSPFIQSFIQKYFYRCQWKGYGLEFYEKGPSYTIDVYYQLPINKSGLGYKGNNKDHSIMEVVDLELESLDYEDLN